MTTRHRAQAAGVTVPKVHGVDKGVDPHVKPEHQKLHPQPAPKHRLPPAPHVPKKTHVPQPRPQAHNQCLSHKLVDRSRSVLNRREVRNQLPTNPPPRNQQPLSMPVPPECVLETPNTLVHVPPFLSPAPAVQKPKAMKEVDAEYDSLMDTDSPYDDTLVEIEYR